MGRILVADDHDALRRGLVRALTQAGNEVEEARNGNVAIQRIRDAYFDVVLADLNTGGRDGLEVLRTTKALHPSTAVILMTAFASVTIAVEAMKSGAFDFVEKPFEIEEIEAKVQEALEASRVQDELDDRGARTPSRLTGTAATPSRIVAGGGAPGKVMGVARTVAQ